MSSELERLEERVIELATAELQRALDDMMATITALYVRTFGDIEAETGDNEDVISVFIGAYVALISGLPLPPAPEQFVALLRRAYLLGDRTAAREMSVVPLSREPARLPEEVYESLEQMRLRVAEIKVDARTLLDTGVRSYADVTAVAAKAQQTTTPADRAASWATLTMHARGRADVMDENLVARVWVPERDACLNCLAYAGQVAQPGQSFPAGLTYGDKPLSDEPVPDPPLHPHCHCEIQAHADGNDDVPEALKREAERVVALGRTDYASEPAKLRAAERLLLEPTSRLPKTVRKKSERAVQRGTFPGK